MPRPLPAICRAHPRFMLCSAFAAMAVTLAGCGDSTQAKHEKIVRCTSFSTALLAQSGDPTVAAAGQALLGQGVTEQDTVPMGQASTTYAAAMDPAKVSRLADEGKAAAMDLLGKKDSQGIANYTKACVGTFKSLGAQ